MNLFAITAIDGRYSEDVQPLAKYFSEFALQEYRVKIECDYLIALMKMIGGRAISKVNERRIRAISENFSAADGKRIKVIEKRVRHDVKAVELFLHERLKKIGCANISSMVHFALTSEDINNIAYTLMWRDALHGVYIPALQRLHDKLSTLSKSWKSYPLLAMTHGQAATPTTVGKEIAVFTSRIVRQIAKLSDHRYEAKLNGATGGFAAHLLAYPGVDWPKFSAEFISLYGLKPNPLTTQVESADSLVEGYQSVIRINSILTDLARDMWLYISRGIFKLGRGGDEVGSSTMPHKVNPIDFENAEGNLGLSSALLCHLASSLPISRLQRDLTGSTLIRNQGSALAHSFIAISRLIQGISKVEPSRKTLDRELDSHWEVLAEAIQTILRKHGVADGYERLRKRLQGERLDLVGYLAIVDELSIPSDDKDMLRKLTPSSYVGLSGI